ncbi:MAG TPA: GNAT family N-acetyltransferase [Herpetosiphonaceae bacterium]
MIDRIEVTRAQPDHIDLVAPLFDGYRQFYGQVSDIEAGRRFLQERISADESVIFVAFGGAAAVGFTQLYPTFSSVVLRRLWILNDLFVAPEARRRGVARALLEHARQFAVQTDAKGLVLETAVDNPAQRLYEALGWRRDSGFYHYALPV